MGRGDKSLDERVTGRLYRIRVDVTSSSFPHWDPNANTGSPIGSDTIAQLVTAVQTIFHDAARPSHILLPVVPRR